MKKILAVILFAALLNSNQAFSVTEQEQEILGEVNQELKFLIEKVMKAKSFSRDGDVHRVDYSKLILDLKEVKINLELAADLDVRHRKIRNLNLNYSDNL